MNTKSLFYTAICIAFTHLLAAQNAGTSDSITKLTAGYLLIEKNGEKAECANMQDLETTVQNISNQQRLLTQVVAQTGGSVENIEMQRRAEKEAKYKKRLRKIQQAPDFVKAANVSMSALTLSSSLTDYLNDVSSLNNPENEELGLSLQTSIVKIIDDKIFHGEAKVGKQKRERFLGVVGTIIRSPLVAGIASAVPVVNSLGAVSDMLATMTANNDDVPLEDYEACKRDIATYVAFYQALGQAGSQFDTKINNLSIRINVLENLLRNFTYERTETLFPDFNASGEPVDINLMTRKYFERDIVTSLVADLEKQALTPDSVSIDYDKLLNDPRLTFPDFAVNQARYISDELQTLSKEYLTAFHEYQAAVEQVLIDAPDIVPADKAEKKIASLRQKLELMEKSFHSAVHMEELQVRFQKFSGN